MSIWAWLLNREHQIERWLGLHPGPDLPEDDAPAPAAPLASPSVSAPLGPLASLLPAPLPLGEDPVVGPAFPALSSWTADDRRAAYDVQRELGLDPKVGGLVSVVVAESGGLPTAQNPPPPAPAGAAGLFQLTRGARLPGFDSPAAIQAVTSWSPGKQFRDVGLPLFRRFWPRGAGPAQGASAIRRLLFLPGLVDKPSDFVLGVREGAVGPGGEKAEDVVAGERRGAIYAGNYGFDLGATKDRATGTISGGRGWFTWADVDASTARVAAQGARRGWIRVSGAVVPPGDPAMAGTQCAPAGTSPESAVVVGSVPQEYDWLVAALGPRETWRWRGQSLQTIGDRWYDRVGTEKDGVLRYYWFDITSFSPAAAMEKIRRGDPAVAAALAQLGDPRMAGAIDDLRAAFYRLEHPLRGAPVAWDYFVADDGGVTKVAAGITDPAPFDAGLREQYAGRRAYVYRQPSDPSVLVCRFVVVNTYSAKLGVADPPMAGADLRTNSTSTSADSFDAATWQWIDLPGGYRAETAAEPLSRAGQRVPMSWSQILDVSAANGWLPPTRAIVDARLAQAQNRALAAPVQSPDGAHYADPKQVAEFARHLGPVGTVLREGAWKSSILDPGDAPLPPKGKGALAFYGWLRPDGGFYEVGHRTGHNELWVEYDQFFAPTKRAGLGPDGQPVDLLDVVAQGGPLAASRSCSSAGPSSSLGRRCNSAKSSSRSASSASACSAPAIRRRRSRPA